MLRNRFLLTRIVLLAAAVCWFGKTSADDAIDFRPGVSFLQLPQGTKLGPCSAVDFDSRGNIYVVQRQSPPILCFDSGGKFLRSWGTSLIGRDPDMQGAHGIRIDKDDF